MGAVTKNIFFVGVFIAVAVGGYFLYRFSVGASARMPVVRVVPAHSVGPCLLIPEREVTAYNRPSTRATIFGKISTTDSPVLSGRTVDGWYGFDPGLTEGSENVGPFRLRYVSPDAPVGVEGDCGTVPTIQTLPVGVCFAIFGAETPLFVGHNASDTPIKVFAAKEYAPLLAREKVNGLTWFKLGDFSRSTSSTAIGWVLGGMISFSSDCKSFID